MILSFRHKGLETFFLTGKQIGIQPIHAKRLRDMLTALNVAAGPEDLARPFWRLHALSGDRAGPRHDGASQLAACVPLRGWKR